MDLLSSILFATVVAGTPLVLVAIGELVCEKSGMLNLGAEGMMSFGAATAFAVAFVSESTLAGLAGGMLAGMLLSLIFAFITIHLMANQVATGLAVAIFGVGLAAFLGKPFEAKVLPSIDTTTIAFLSDIPVLGKALFDQQWMVYGSWVIFAGLVWFLSCSRGGLIIKAVGESPASAHAIGISVVKVRYLSVLFGGAMAGLGGAFLSLFHTPLWTEGLVAGKGWIALALVVFATWRPWRVLLGACNAV